ncbi:MAG: hypothetical protein RLZZ453_268 [Chlamydiota bacterium]
MHFLFHEVDLQGAQVISLDGSMTSDLRWEGIPHNVLSCVFDLDLGWDSFVIKPNDSATFQSLWLVLEEFSKRVLALYEKQTIGVVLYRGSFDLSSLFPPFLWEENPWQLFAEYLHRLTSVLPEHVKVFVLFDTKGHEITSVLKQVTKERFKHLIVGIDGLELHQEDKGVKTAIILAAQEKWDELFSSALEECLKEMKHPFRLIGAVDLHQEWEGLEEVIIPLREMVDRALERQLNGFIAAGGTVLYKKPIGAEGFEPPTHCSQSSCASQTALCSDRK